MIAKALSTSRKYGRLHEVAGKRAEFCQALYPLLVAHADDFGRLPGDVYTVKHLIIPTSPRKETDLLAALASLHLVGLINWYEAGDVKCIQINNFDAHQQGLHKRTRSAFPEPSGNPPEMPSEQNRTEEKGTEEKRTNDHGALRARFDRFWEVYPRKVAKDAALKEWLKRSPDDALTDLMIASVHAQRASEQWRRDDGKYIPHARTWLHGGRWQDEGAAPKPERVAWICPHVDQCSHRAMCQTKTTLGAEKYPVKAAS